MNKNIYKISVICPCYNSSKYILRLTDTILNQSYKVDEIVFVDDGSKDNTFELLKKSKILFVKEDINFVLKKTENLGAGNARNIAIKASRNNWIAFLDSDDTWHKDKILYVTKIINENNKVNTILNWEKFIRLDGSIIELRHGKNFKNSNLSSELYKGNFFSTSALVLQKNIIISNNYFDIKLKNAQDYEMWLKMSKDINLYIIKKFLGNYIEEKTSITMRPFRKRFFNEILIAFRYKNYVPYSIFIKKIFQIILSRRWISQ